MNTLFSADGTLAALVQLPFLDNNELAMVTCLLEKDCEGRHWAGCHVQTLAALGDCSTVASCRPHFWRGNIGSSLMEGIFFRANRTADKAPFRRDQ